MAAIAVVSLKGGAGKSTATTNLAAALAQDNADVCVLDADSNRSTAKWAGDRALTDLPIVHCVEKTGNLRPVIKDLRSRYEHVIVDTPGQDSQEMRTAITEADLVVIPVRPSQLDLDAVEGVVDLIRQAKDLNPKLKAVFLLSQVPTYSGANEGKEAREYLADYEDIPMLDVTFGYRKAYRDAVSEGRGAVEMKNPDAKGEVSVFVKEIFETWL